MPDLAIPELPFPRGITPIDAGGEIRDLFAPPRSKETRHSDDTEGADNGRAANEKLSASVNMSSESFAATHRLHGVFVDERLRIANVDGRWMGCGTTVDGCTLITVSPEYVIFRCFDDHATLVLDHASRELPH
ncbi:MAG: hypothetical protein ACE5HE_11830 [Phycisphaerae bacterium]